jgi:hypothetical protein
MDNPTTLLVAIMYVMIISIGLSNLLMALSDLVGGRLKVKPDRVHTSWLLLLLFAYFNYFWQTTAILEIDDWQFLSFIGFLTGPMCLLFGTNLLVVMPDSDDISPQAHYMQHSNRFFLLLCLFNAWVVGLDYFSENMTMDTWVSGIIALLCFALMASDSYKVHKLAAPVGWVLILTSAGLGAI